MKVFGSFGNAGVIAFKNKKLQTFDIFKNMWDYKQRNMSITKLKFDIDPIHAAHINENFNVYNKLKQKD